MANRLSVSLNEFVPDSCLQNDGNDSDYNDCATELASWSAKEKKINL